MTKMDKAGRILSDIEIAQMATPQPIKEIAAKVDLTEDDIEYYGKYKAKVDYNLLTTKYKDAADGHLILVTAITPTPAGEGKTTTSTGLADGLNFIGERVVLALREPSLGPVFGVKGGAAGGGFAQVVPMEDINLHFTGDFHAIGAANNLIAAMLDNHIYQGNDLGIDNRRIIWRRCIDMNDRQLRNVVNGLGGPTQGVVREDGFDITVASEIMALFCLASDIDDLKARIARVIVAYTRDGQPITVGQLKAEGACAALLKDALKPNLVQTLEGTPAFIHGGPFANIAHGCNSVMATKLALKMAGKDGYVVTEGGFGGDLGAEKFLDIKARAAGLNPECVVIVATVRALKMHGGVPKDKLADSANDLASLEKGLANLTQHIENMKKFGLPSVVAINAFPLDTPEELKLVEDKVKAYGANVVLSKVWADGGEGGADLAKEVVRIIKEGKANFKPIYPLEMGLKEKIETIAKEIYRADGVDFVGDTLAQIATLEKLGFGNVPICMAKTQYSFSDNPALLGAPRGFRVSVRNVKISAGAGFAVVLTGAIMTMPGLPKVPSAEKIDVDNTGKIAGLF